jgi:hypothetical protein
MVFYNKHNHYYGHFLSEFFFSKHVCETGSCVSLGEKGEECFVHLGSLKIGCVNY